MDDVFGGYLPSEKAAEINRARMQTYGSPIVVFPRTAAIWSAILGITVSEEQVAACMIGMKLAREAQAGYDPSYLDNAEDICGYANCLHLIKQHHEDERQGPSKLDQATQLVQKGVQ